MANGRNREGNLPLYSLASVALLVALGLVGAILADNQRAIELLIGLIVTTVPSLIAAAYAERTSRDIRNGVLTSKVVDALDETGVTTAAETAKSLAPAQAEAITQQSRALAMLLSERIASQNASAAQDNRMAREAKQKTGDGE